MRVLIDTNIVLDFLQAREPFVEDAAKLFEQIDAGKIEGFIAATTLTNIYYIVRKAAGLETATDAITQVLTDLQICTIDRSLMQQAIALNFRDFEDAVQYACAVAYAVDAIVTRDKSGSIDTEIPIVSAGELISSSNYTWSFSKRLGAIPCFNCQATGQNPTPCRIRAVDPDERPHRAAQRCPHSSLDLTFNSPQSISG